ncbi:hypothetical protein AMTR_s00059p00194330 [Amborella trichopoda]|uniref:Vacuolar protein sorting-associated protein 13 VPS13 adaptor binding domain-containing protein n=1 Tax=Amborella trichopoda TaxID=13333 RepID=U5CWG6_AMBTC|nr:hypothetical protein AMTR_s00059p00194330 [Amborella trichopoda]
MVLNEALRARVASLLGPWLEEEAELDLKLGFLESKGSAKNLLLNVSALNRVINESNSPVEFEVARIEHLQFMLKPWSRYAFTFEVHGVHVTLTPRGMGSSSGGRVRAGRWSEQTQKEMLALLDPEGTFWHETLRRISTTTNSEPWLSTALTNAILQHCRVQLHDVRIQLPLSRKNELSMGAAGDTSHDLFLRVKEVSMVTYEVLDTGNSRQAMRNKTTESSEKVENVINGKELWKRAACRISGLTARLYLQRLVDTVIIWKRYVHAYETLLLQVGYCADTVLTKMSSTCTRDRGSFRYINCLWLEVCGIEKKLPVEAVAVARRVARYRAKAHSKNITSESMCNSYIMNMHRVLGVLFSLIKCLCRVIYIPFFFLFMTLCKLLRFVSCLLWFTSHDGYDQWLENEMPSPVFKSGSHVRGHESSKTQQCFTLNIGRIFIRISHENRAQLTNRRKTDAVNKPPGILLGSVIFVLNSLCLSYDVNDSANFLSLTYGQFDIQFSPSSRMKKEANQLEKEGNFEGIEFEADVVDGHDFKKILWSMPAPQVQQKGKGNSINYGNDFRNAWTMLLENHLSEMWSDWKISTDFCIAKGIPCSREPFLILEVKAFAINPYLNGCGSGFLKIGLAAGKLNFDLDHSTMASVSLLVMQLKYALCNTSTRCGLEKVSSHSSTNINGQPSFWWGQKYGSFINNMKKAFPHFVPEKNVQVGVAIAGPNVHISIPRQGSLRSMNDMFAANVHDNYSYTLGLEKIELAFWPASSTLLCALDVPHSGEATSEYVWLKKPPLANILKHSSNGSYNSQERLIHNAHLSLEGVYVFMEELVENRRLQVIDPVSITLQSTSYREDLISLTSAVRALSITLGGMMTGLTITVYINELLACIQVLSGMLSAIPFAFCSVESERGLPVRASPDYGNSSTQRDAITNGNDRDRSKSENFFAISIFKDTSFLVDFILELSSINVVLENSWIHLLHTDITKGGYASSSSPLSGAIHGILSAPELGLGLSVQKSCLHLSFEELGPSHMLFDVSGIQAAILRCQSISEAEGRVLHLQSADIIYDFSISDFNFSVDTWPDICVSSPEMINSTDGNSSISWKDWYNFRDSATITPDSPCWLLLNATLGESILLDHSLKNSIKISSQEASSWNKLQVLLSVGREFQSLSCDIEGGLIVLETKALVMFMNCLGKYHQFITNALSCIPCSLNNPSREQGEASGTQEIMDYPDTGIIQGEGSSDSTMEAAVSKSEMKWKFMEDFMIRVSSFSLGLAVADSSVGIWEVLLEVDFQLKHEMIDLRRKMIFDLSRFTIAAPQLRKGCDVQRSEVQIPHFHSGSLDDSLSNKGSGDLIHTSPVTKSMLEVVDDEFSSKPLAPQGEHSIDGGKYEKGSWHGHYILKQMSASIKIEEPPPEAMHDLLLRYRAQWVGGGSFSGLHLAFTTSEIQILLGLTDPLFEISTGKANDGTRQLVGSWYEQADGRHEDKIPDGSIVVIEDLDQHMYLTVETGENKYRLGGALHYSLVGERALFRVAYHRRKWGSPTACFSLVSLCAKNDVGEPLRVNFQAGSGFVDVSAADDKSWACWKTVPCRPKYYEGSDELEVCNNLLKGAFYLVNQKNDCAVAFIDGLPQFVKKPGNPFKAKILLNLSLRKAITAPEASDTYTSKPGEIDGVSKSLLRDEANRSVLPHHPSYVNITTDKISVTLLYEVSGTNDNIPLLRWFIDNAQFIVQVSPSKMRLISTLSFLIESFDTLNNSWREMVLPVAIGIFCRTSLVNNDLGLVKKRVTSHLHCNINKVDMCLSELSLDALLFLTGELNLAGPFSVRHPLNSAACFKVKNLSGLSLLCRFEDERDAVIAANQCGSFLIRKPQTTTSVSLQLVVPGVCFTSPIHKSILDAGVSAWRTRIVSIADSRILPGPLIVVDISKRSQDGLSLVISPMLKIHNESGFTLELRCRRPQEINDESPTVLLRNGDSIDDSMAASDALNMTGGLRRALLSLSLGNFLLSFRPKDSEYFRDFGPAVSMEWSEELKGGKAVRVSGLFDKLSYHFRKTFGSESVKSTFNTIRCTLSVQGSKITDLNFLVQRIGRDVPVWRLRNVSDSSEVGSSHITLQEQKEIFILPSVHVYNNLQSEITVVLAESLSGLNVAEPYSFIGKRATIPAGASAHLYANPCVIIFVVTLPEYNMTCKPVSTSDWLKKMHKLKDEVPNLDIELDFGGGKFLAYLRLLRGKHGVLEAAVFTRYTLKNVTDLSLLCLASKQKSLSRGNVMTLPLEHGFLLPPGSSMSWFLKSNRVLLTRVEDNSSESLLDLEWLSGFTEICLEVPEESGFTAITKLGVSLQAVSSEVILPAELVSIVPRYVVFNESQEDIFVRQCHLQDDAAGVISVNNKQKAMLYLHSGSGERSQMSIFDSIVRRHRNADESFFFIQFSLKDIGLGWSGPVCVASLGNFFVKFRRQPFTLGSDQSTQSNMNEINKPKFAAINIAEEDCSIVIHFRMKPDFILPYRIENHLHNMSVTYYQKGCTDLEVLSSGSSVDYVWDDLTLLHKLVVQVADAQLFREISIDKLCAWKPFRKLRQNKGLPVHFPFDRNLRGGKEKSDKDGGLHGLEMLRVGYEVYADGPTRVLRICELVNSCMQRDEVQRLFPCTKIGLRTSSFAIRLLESVKPKNDDASETSMYSEIIVTRLGGSILDCILSDQHKLGQIRIQSLNVDEKWQGAPFAAMLRRNQQEGIDMNDHILMIEFVLYSPDSGIKQVKYSSFILQPIDLNLDEETLMKLVPFWRTSHSQSKAGSQQIYLKHFEIHPVKIIASLLPGSPHAGYTSAQETLRSLLHTVTKIPTVKGIVVELNGILLSHALVTVRELRVKCARHYSWYALRAIYIAKGSPLLPPAFASLFDDSASSSLDFFFDPSSKSINLGGLTLGMFRFVSKCINTKGFSGTKRYFGDLGKTVKKAGSHLLFAAITEISDSVLKGAEASGFNGMVIGFHQGILKLAMEPTLLGAAVMEGGPNRRIKLDRNPGVDELYIEGYLQAMLDVLYKQEYLRVKVFDDQVLLKNLPPNSSLIDEIMKNVKSFLISEALLKGDPSHTTSRSLRLLRGENEWKIGPTVLTLCEHLFVSFVIRTLRKQAGKVIGGIKWKRKSESGDSDQSIDTSSKGSNAKLSRKGALGKFVLSSLIAYIDGRLCRHIPNAISRRIVSGFLLSFLDNNDKG